MSNPQKQVPPTVEGKLLSGSLWDFRRDPLNFISEVVEKHGDFVRIRFAWQYVYLISDPEILQKNSGH